MKIGLCVYSFTGASREAGLRPDPYNPFDLMEMAAVNGMESVEFHLASPSTEDIQRYRSKLESLGLKMTLAGGRVTAADLGKSLHTAKALGATAIRTVLSGLLEGDRRKSPGPEWPQFLENSIEELKEVAGLAEDLGIPIGVENHQDSTSDDLLYLCESVNSPMVGVTLDCGNALAVGEDCIAFARKIARHTKNVHLKDYWVYLSESGYRLVRCAFGDGVVPFKELYEIFDAEAPTANRNIENGATVARHIQLLEDFFWQYYPPRSLESVLPALRVAHRQARPAGEDWRTPHERNEPAAVRAEYEMAQFRRSVENARKLLG